MYPVMLKVGMVIYLRKDDEEQDVEEYKSRVIDIEDGLIMIDYPIHVETGRTTFFIDGTKLQVMFTNDAKVSYRFETKIAGRRLAEIPMLQLTHEGEASYVKIQRREFVRVDTTLDVAVEIDTTILRLVSTDISAGGMALNLPALDTLEEGMNVSLLIVLPFMHRKIEYIRTKAKVVRVFEKNQRAIASLKFLTLSDTDQQQVIQYCFERQLQLKKKIE